MTCKKCGAEIKAGAKFCTTCGAPANADDTQAAQQETPAGAANVKKAEKGLILATILAVAVIVCGALGFLAVRHILQSRGTAEDASMQAEETNVATEESAEAETSALVSADNAADSVPEGAVQEESAATDRSFSPASGTLGENFDGSAGDDAAYAVTIENASPHISIISADSGAKSGDTVLVQLQVEDGYGAAAQLTDSSGNSVAHTIQNKILSFTMPDSDVVVSLSESVRVQVVKDSGIESAQKQDTYWASGDTVTLQYSLEEGYTLSAIHAVTLDSTEIIVQNDVQAGKCSFVMPEQPVSVTFTAEKAAQESTAPGSAEGAAAESETASSAGTSAAAGTTTATDTTAAVGATTTTNSAAASETAATAKTAQSGTGTAAETTTPSASSGTESRTISVCSKETTYYADGSINGWSEYAYDDNGKKVSEKAYDANGNAEYTWTYTYDSAGHQLTWKIYGSDASLSYWVEYTYDSNGKRQNEKNYSSDGSLRGWSENTYDSAGNMISVKHYYSSGDLSYWYEYTYDNNGEMQTSKYYLSDGSLYSWTEYTYDNAGKTKTSKNYNNDGSLDGWIVTTYGSNGYLQSIMFYGSEGNLTFGHQYTYDQNNNLIRGDYLTEGGALESYTLFEYITMQISVK